MSRIIKSNQVVLDKTRYKLAPRYVTQINDEALSEDGEFAEGDGHHEEPEIIVPEVDIEALVAERMVEVDDQIAARLQETEDDREMILREAYEQAQSITEKAREDGYEEGQRQGFEEGRQVSEGLIQDALEIKNKLQNRKVEIADEIEAQAVNLVISTVQRILNKHIDEDVDMITGIIKLALEKCAYTEKLSLRVAEEDYNLAIGMKNRILALAENVGDIDIKCDSSLAAGSCVIDTEAGSVDSSIWTQFEHVKETFEGLLHSE